MATVYLAEDPSLSRLVAIKVIQTHLTHNSSLLQRFTTEAQVVAAIRNPNIVEVFDFNTQAGQQYIVMEYMDGPTLGYICSSFQGKGLPPDIATSFICQAAEGLVAAEKKGVVHRDIKPENLMVNSEGYLKIADFGIAHLSEEQSLTMTGDLLGSPNFMSPEQVEGHRPTHQTDLWSLGGIYYFCLSGQLPFSGPNITSTLRKIVETEPKPLTSIKEGIHPDILNLITGLLKKSPEERPTSALQVAKQLRNILAQKGITNIQEHIKSFLTQIEIPQINTIVEAAPSSDSPSPKRNLSDGGEMVFPPRDDSLNIFENPEKDSIYSHESGNQFSFHHKLAWLGLFLTATLLSVTFYFWTLKQKNHIDPPTIQQSIEKLIFARQNLELLPGSTEKIKLTITPPHSDTLIHWVSTDTSVASVKNGVIHAKSPGPTLIMARSINQPDVRAVCSLVVVKIPEKPEKTIRVSNPQINTGKKKKSISYKRKELPTPILREKRIEPPTPILSEIKILSTPPFAALWVNGEAWGDTPMNSYRQIKPGPVKIELVHKLYPPFDTVITLKGGTKQKMKFKLMKN